MVWMIEEVTWCMRVEFYSSNVNHLRTWHC